MTRSATDNHSTKSMQEITQNRIVALRANVDNSIRKIESSYKLKYNPYIREIPSYTPGPYVFIDNLNLRPVPDALAEAILKHTDKYHPERTSGPHRILSVQRTRPQSLTTPVRNYFNQTRHARTFFLFTATWPTA